MGLTARYWEKQEEETDTAYHAFAVFRDLGPTRSTYKVARELAKSDSLVRRWSSKHDWVARARAYEDHLEYIGQRAIEEHTREKAKDLVERRSTIQERVVDLQERLVERAEAMLEHGLTREVVIEEAYEDGRPKIERHIYPVRWSFNTAIKAIEVLNEFKRGSPTHEDPSHAWGESPEQLRARGAGIIEEMIEEGIQRELGGGEE